MTLGKIIAKHLNAISRQIRHCLGRDTTVCKTFIKKGGDVAQTINLVEGFCEDHQKFAKISVF